MQLRFLRFALSGGLVMAVQIGMLAVLSRVLSHSLAFSGAYSIAVATHYSLNRFWALRSTREDIGRQTLEYGLTVAASFLINFASYLVVLRAFGLSPVLAALLTNPPTTAIVFIVLNFRVFRA